MATRTNKPVIAISAPVTITAGQGEGESKGPAKFVSTFYTGGKLNIAGWDLPVVVDLDAMTQSKVLVANLDHDPSRRVGNFAVANDKKSLVASGTASAATSARDEVVNSAMAGYEWQSSLEVNPQKVTEVKAGKTVTINGQEQEGPLYRVAGMLKGFAFVSHGADDNTTATIAASAASNREIPMKAEVQAWVEASLPSLDIANLSADEVKNLEGQYAGLHPAKPKNKVKALEKLDAIDADADRVEAITDYAEKLCAKNKYDSEYRKQIRQLAEEAIEGTWTVDKFRLEALEAGLPVKGSVICGRRDTKVDEKVIEAALASTGRLQNIDKHFTDQQLQTARDKFKNGIGLKQLILMAAESNGYRCSYSSDVNRDVLRAAFPDVRASGYSALDISTIVSNTANKFMMEGWNEIDQVCLSVGKIYPVRDFKQITVVSLTDSVIYEEVGTTGEIPHGTLGELTYTQQAKTYARMLAITRQDIINDDTGSLTSVPAKLGRGAIKKLNSIFWTEFLALVGANFFGSGNANINTGVADMTVGGLAATEAIFLRQTNPDGTPLGLQAGILLVPPALAPAARTLMNSELLIGGSGVSGATNIWRQRFEVLTSAYISDSTISGNTSTAWWMLANPNTLPVIGIAALNGRVEPTVDTAEADFNTLGIQMRGYSDVGVHRQEFRGGVHADGGSS